ncbi:uncharacterized protein LOC124310397 isoform X2 [Neodiprion virginianus]|nr:uncharacterized protein LOC124310397 isoform X2 [Neodiprion virginianus]
MGKKKSLKNGSCSSPAKAGLEPRKESSSPSSPSSPSFSSTESSPIRDEEGVEFLRCRRGPVSPHLYPLLDGLEEVNDKLDLSTCNQHANQSRDTSSSSISSKPKFTPESKKRLKRNKDEKSNWFMPKIMIGAFVLFVIVLVIVFVPVYFNLPYAENSNATVDFDVFDDVNSRMNDIVKLFPSQNESIWSYFTSGIAEVKNKMHRPAVFLLLAPVSDTTAICLAKKVAEVTRSTLGGTGDAMLSPDELENDINKVFKLIKEQVTRTKTAIFLDLLNIKPQALRALHDICDPDYPLVKEAVYLIIMKSELYKESENLVGFAEQQLNNTFSSVISEDILRPLITRITAGAVLPIRAEKNLPCSKYDIS